MATEKQYKVARRAQLERMRVLAQATDEAGRLALNKAVDHFLAGHPERWLTLDQWFELHKVSGDELIAELQHEENKMLSTFGPPWGSLPWTAAKEEDEEEDEDNEDYVEEFFVCQGCIDEEQADGHCWPHELKPGEFTCCATCNGPFCHNCINDEGECPECNAIEEQRVQDLDWEEQLDLEL